MYYGQYEQDKILNERFFKNKKNGVFCDVGAHNGINISNTYFFEKELGWTGLCIEAQKKEYDELVKNRKKESCLCVYGAAYNRDGTVEFRENSGYTNMLSGIDSHINERHRHRLISELIAAGGSSKIVKVPCYRLKDLFKRHNIKKVDYLTIDTEGSELQVLQGIDFREVDIHVIDVEVNYPNSPEHLQIKELLRENGYTFCMRLVGDEIWEKQF